MTRAAALKAVRTMRAKKSSRHDAYRTTSQRMMDIEMGRKNTRLERASRAVHHRKRKRKR